MFTSLLSPAYKNITFYGSSHSSHKILTSWLINVDNFVLITSHCIASLVSVGRLLGHLLWLTGKCVQLNWSSILLDGYKKRSLLRQPLCEDRRVLRPSTLYRATGQGHCQKIQVSLFIYLISYCLFHFCFSFYNQFLLCVSTLLLVSMCVWQCSFFFELLILQPFDLSILILDKLCMNLICIL